MAKIKIKQREGKKSKKKIVITIIVVVVILIFGLRSCFGGSENVGSLVETQKAEKGNVTEVIELSGVVESGASKEYTSSIAAEIGEVNVKQGDSVKAGDYLLTYDTDALENTYTLADLQAKADAANANDSRNKSSKSQSDKASAESKINEYNGQISAKQADIKTLQKALTEYQVTLNNNEKEAGDLQSQLEELNGKQQNGQSLNAEEQGRLSAIKKRLDDINNQNTSIANNKAIIDADMSNKQEEISNLQAKLSEAEGEKSSAEATILSENAQATLDYTSQSSKLTVTKAENELSVAKAGITAEADGIVTEVQAVNGAAATEGQTLVTVAGTDKMEVECQVSKANLEKIEIGQKAVITSLGNEYTGTVERISKIATKTDSGSTMVNAVVSIDDPDDKLVLGLDAKVNVTTAKESDVTVVPLVGVNTDVDGDFVYVVENGIVKRCPVTVGISEKDRIQILDGIKPGQEIITTVDESIMDGMPVTVKPAEEKEQADAVVSDEAEEKK